MIVNNIIEQNRSSVIIRKDSFTDLYDVKSEIGRGKFAVVKKCIHKTTSVEHAAKFLHKRRRGRDTRLDVLHEVEMLNLTKMHPHIVNLVEVFETTHDYVLVTEYVRGGELFQHIDVDGRIDEKTAVKLLRQILSAVNFLHENNILHLDIKPQNILLTDAPVSGDVKLCDFGLARPFNRGSDVVELVGTLDYVAPEVLDYVALNAACDMWSIGVLAYVMLTGHSPFAGDSRQETLLNISQVNLDFPDDLFVTVSKSAIDFISRLLVKHPRERMTSKQCLEHCWLSAECDAERSNSKVVNDAMAAMSPSLPRCRLLSSIGSPSGQRRSIVMTLTSDDDFLVNHEPTKKSRCEIDEVRELTSSIYTTTVSAVSSSNDVIIEVVNNENSETTNVEALSDHNEITCMLSPPCLDISVT